MSYREYKSLDLPGIAAEVLQFWKEGDIYQKSIETREGAENFVFYEGPPSANGMPGIHHVMARAIKDIFCRYKTLQGYKVPRKSGWDTHGLPVELQVEKRLGLKKEDIGKKISVAEYNEECRKDVMKFQDVWKDLTEKMGYWLDLDNPYVTYHSEYIETLWSLLKRLYDRGLLYKGYSIQPYSPAAGTGLSSHELNQPGAYRPVKDVTAVAMFKIVGKENEFFLAWTTTPWTLPSNTALAVGENIDYVKVHTLNPYTREEIFVILAKETFKNYFNTAVQTQDISGQESNSLGVDPEEVSKRIEERFYESLSDPNSDPKTTWRIVSTLKGKDLKDIRYEQLLPYVQPDGDAFRVIVGDFVTTEEGTGIVHISPTFGADDMRVAQQCGIPALTVTDPENPIKQIPLVDRTGKFVKQMGELAGRYVKNYRDEQDYVDVNVDIVIKLKKEGRVFRSEKMEHNYPHCWRTDKPVLYYPLDSWFIKTTAFKDRLIELNNTINWKPASTGYGRFGNWLENLVDWNLSRSRFWGTPLPVWQTEDGNEIKCIGSIEELRAEAAKAVEKGFIKDIPPQDINLHRPYVDEIVLVSDSGKPMNRVPDVIDVWFDSGAMPYAQWHYPFENHDIFEKNFPADFIAEGVDQTRGWFFTLHALAVMLFDSVAFKNVVSNGLVLDKNGNKMSKRLGNAVDPFEVLGKFGPDATRWYMVHNAQPWDNLKFDIDALDEVRKKFFGTVYNVYSFFALYANIDGFEIDETNVVPVKDRSELDRWIISELHSMIKEATDGYETYEPTRVARAIQDFAIDHLSNWYVRLSRRRFWKGEMTVDKKAAYETLYECLAVISQLSAPIAPFFAEWLYKNLTDGVRVKAQEKNTPLKFDSVHLTYLTKAEEDVIDKDLEERMELAQQVSSLVLSLRKKSKIRVRQPLSKVMIPVLDRKMQQQLEKVADLIISEVNVKELEFLTDTTGILVKKIKPDFKKLGPKYGAKMKQLQAAFQSITQEEIAKIEQEGSIEIRSGDEVFTISREEAEILSEDIPGWLVAGEGKVTVALDITITEKLKHEGIARELINRIQNLRKDKDFEVTDHIAVKIQDITLVHDAVLQFKEYICTEILADELILAEMLGKEAEAVEIEEENILLDVKKIQR